MLADDILIGKFGFPKMDCADLFPLRTEPPHTGWRAARLPRGHATAAAADAHATRISRTPHDTPGRYRDTRTRTGSVTRQPRACECIQHQRGGGSTMCAGLHVVRAPCVRLGGLVPRLRLLEEELLPHLPRRRQALALRRAAHLDVRAHRAAPQREAPMARVRQRRVSQLGLLQRARVKRGGARRVPAARGARRGCVRTARGGVQRWVCPAGCVVRGTGRAARTFA